MLFNKRHVHKINCKKILHKIGKFWVTISIAFLSLIGAKTTAAHLSANVNAKANVNHQLDQLSVNSAKATLTHSNGAELSSLNSEANVSSKSTVSASGPADRNSAGKSVTPSSYAAESSVNSLKNVKANADSLTRRIISKADPNSVKASADRSEKTVNSGDLAVKKSAPSSKSANDAKRAGLKPNKIADLLDNIIDYTTNHNAYSQLAEFVGEARSDFSQAAHASDFITSLAGQTSDVHHASAVKADLTRMTDNKEVSHVYDLAKAHSASTDHILANLAKLNASNVARGLDNVNKLINHTPAFRSVNLLSRVAAVASSKAASVSGSPSASVSRSANRAAEKAAPANLASSSSDERYNSNSYRGKSPSVDKPLNRSASASAVSSNSGRRHSQIAAKMEYDRNLLHQLGSNIAMNKLFPRSSATSKASKDVASAVAVVNSTYQLLNRALSSINASGSARYSASTSQASSSRSNESSNQNRLATSSQTKSSASSRSDDINPSENSANSTAKANGLSQFSSGDTKRASASESLGRRSQAASSLSSSNVETSASDSLTAALLLLGSTLGSHNLE